VTVTSTVNLPAHWKLPRLLARGADAARVHPRCPVRLPL